MKQNNLLKTLLLLVLAMCWGTELVVADTPIPLTTGTYLTTSESTTTGTINNNEKGNLGSIKKDATATFTLTNASEQDMVLCFLTGNDNNSSPQVIVTMTDGGSYSFTKTVDVENTGSWTPFTMHSFDVGKVPAGTITLTFAFTNTSKYVCNLGSIGIYNKSNYIATLDNMPGDITLSKGNYPSPTRYNDSNNGRVGWLSNGAKAYYPSLYVGTAGAATLNIGMTYNGDGTMNVQIADNTTGTVEVNKDLTITSEVCQGLTTPTAFELGNITAGFKTMKLTMSTSANFLIDYQALSLGITPSSWSDIAIDLLSGQLGTEANTAYTKYLAIDGETYNYQDAKPDNYNALLSTTKWNDNQHGYEGLKAKIPVEAGIYKITLGTCQYGTGTGYVKNADESSTLTIVDENGQTQTSFNQDNGTCYHNNTTDNVISVWYTAASDEIITIVCGQYTPYFAIEKVSSVPELKYTVTYVNNTADVSGTVPATAKVAAGENMTIPANRTLYKEGYTLTGWRDGSTTYAAGDTYTPAANSTLTAVFEQNTYSLSQALSETTVCWDLRANNGTPVKTWQNTTGFLVAQATVNGSEVDVKMDIDATNGKFDVVSRGDYCQINNNTIVKLPTVSGMTITIDAWYDTYDYEIDGTAVDQDAMHTIYTYNGTTDPVPVKFVNSQYFNYIEVIYPASTDNLFVKAITVDGVAMDGAVLAPINFATTHNATFSTNVYTTVPTVIATFGDDTSATGVVSGTGTSRTYTFEKTLNETEYTFVLNVEGIHVYTATGSEESIDIKYNEGTVESNVWTNGVYTFTTSGINSSGGADFKFDANTDLTYTISVPADVVVKQFIIKNFHANYSGGDGQLKTVTSYGATTYIPTKHTCVYSGETTAENRTYEGPAYDLVVTVESHTAGTPIVFTMKKSAQPMGWIQLTTVKQNPGTAPVKNSESVTVVNNHAVVAVTFDREIANNVEATINGGTVTAEGGASTLYFPVWDLSYSTNYTLTIAPNAAEDTYGNKNASTIEVAVNVPAKASVAVAAYDYVVGTVAELTDAIAAVNASNTSTTAARKTIFIKNGEYNLGTEVGTGKSLVRLSCYNVSLIGESRDGVVLYGETDGISNPVLNLRDRSGFYLQDLTVKNTHDYGNGKFDGGVAVAIYGGNKTIMKNVCMLSNQDTQVTGHRAYFENCKIHGTVDFICGGGDNFYYQTDLVLENRSGNCITAPSTSSSQKWGYVFQHSTISGLDDTSATTNSGSYSLGRPWQDEPRCYFLNTTMNVLPATTGWAGMSELPTHFYEYNSMDADGNAIDLSGRTNSSTSTNTYSPVLTAAEAARFTLENVLGGTDSWLPTDYTTVMAAPVVSLSGNTLSWTEIEDARCYVIFLDDNYVANVTTNSYDVSELGSGNFTVRAANEMGGLGLTSNGTETITLNEANNYTPAKKTNVTVSLTRTIAAITWSTIVLPFDVEASEIATIFGEGASVAEFKGGDENNMRFSTTLTDSKMKANQPYAIKVASDFSTKEITNRTIVEATPTQNTTNWNFVGTYTNGNIPSGSYFFSGNKLWQATDNTNTIKPFRGYFTYTGANTAKLAKSVPFVLDNGETTAIGTINADGQMETKADGVFYNLAGQRVANPRKGLYIVNGKKVILK